LRPDKSEREIHWTDSIAVGSKSFIEEVKKSLGFKAIGRSMACRNDHYELREDVSLFGNTSLPGANHSKRSDSDTNNTFVWSDIS
jgi:hypothetical protein